MQIIKYADLASDTTVFGAIGRGVKGAVCSVYSQYKSWYEGVPSLDNPVGNALRDLWNGICSGSPPLTAKPPLFSGGQCPVYYSGTYNIRKYFSDTAFQDASGTTGSLVGPIGGARVRPREGEPGQWQIEVAAANCAGKYSPEPGWCRVGVVEAGFVKVDVTSMQFARQDGQPDNCGSLPSETPTPSPPPPQAITNINTTINHNNTSFNVPVSIDNRLTISAELGVTLNAYIPLNFTIAPSLNPVLNVNLNPSLNLNPTLNVVFSPFGVGFIVSPPGGGVTGGDLPPADEEKKKKWLRVVLTKMPDKSQFAPSGNTVYFAGWVTFKVGDSWLPREQINFARSVFRYPDGATDHEVVFTNKAAGTVSTYED